MWHGIVQAQCLGEVAVANDVQNRREGFGAHHVALFRHFYNRRRHVVGVREFIFQLTLAAEHLAALAQGLFQGVLHVFEAVFVDQRADQVAFQRVADAHLGIGGLEAGNDFFFDRLMGDQPTQGGATLASSAHGAEQDRAYGHVQVGAWAEDHRVVAAQFKDAAGKACGDFRRHFAAHAGAAGGADQGDTRVIHQCGAGVAAADDHLAEVLGGIGEFLQHALEQRLASQCGERGLFRRFPDHGVAAHQRQRGVPRPYGDREVESADHADHAQRVPGFAHVVAWALGSDGQAVQLAGQAYSEVADVDHFLHFTQPFLGDFAGFPGHQLAQVGLIFAQHITELTHQLAATRCRYFAPGVKCMLGATDLLLHLGGTFPVHTANTAAINRRMHGLFTRLVQRWVYPETVKQCGNHGSLLQSTNKKIAPRPARRSRPYL